MSGQELSINEEPWKVPAEIHGREGEATKEGGQLPQY